jgi:hypothetical protein
MTSQGSTWKGFNTVPTSPSTTQSIFEAQMNAYFSYTGFTEAKNNALMVASVSNNQDPITIFNYNSWFSDFTWVSIITPVCPLCPDGEFSFVSDGAINYTATDVYKSMIFYYSGNAITQGYYRFYTTHSSTGMRQSNSTTDYNVNTLVCPVTPTPTTTSTQTQTPSVTQTQTSTPTVTPTSFAVCPTEMYIDGISGIWSLPDQSYYRLNYYDNVLSAGTFTGGYLYFNGSTTTFIPGASPSGITYSVFGTFSGTDYYNIVAYTTNLSTYSWRGFKSLADYYINTGTLISSSILNSTAVGTTIDGVVFPNPGRNNLNSATVIYPSICPTATATPTTTSTPTTTPTPTITPTCSTFTTQYLRSQQQGNQDIRFTLFDNPNFTGNANAVCDYTITGTYDIDGGAINQPYTTIMAKNDHNHTYDTGSNITGFTVSNVVPVCPCVNVVFNQNTPTPTPTITQTETPTMTSTPTQTGTSPLSTPTQTSTPTASCGCLGYSVNPPTISGEQIIVEYVDCYGVNQVIDIYWTSTSQGICALSYNVIDYGINGSVTPFPYNCCSDFPTTTPTQTQTQTPSVTLTQTPSSTPPCTNTIYTHGAIRATCSDFCNTNYLIQTTDCASEVYASLSIGDFIYGYSGQAGYLAYSNVSTDTNTGPFRIADIDGTGEILGIYVCSGGSCIPL